jgi:hypothetical protein
MRGPHGYQPFTGGGAGVKDIRIRGILRVSAFQLDRFSLEVERHPPKLV